MKKPKWMFSWLREILPGNTLPDKDLVERAKRGEKESFGKLYLRYIDPIYRYIYFKCGQNKQVAEDITSDVFIKAYKKLGTFDNKGSFKAWLYKIARNTLIDHHRTQKEEITFEEGISGESDENIDTLAKRDNLTKLKRSFNKLTKGQKDVILLRFVEGYSHKQTAKVMGKSVEASRALQKRALKKLRELMKHETK